MRKGKGERGVGREGDRVREGQGERGMEDKGGWLVLRIRISKG